MFVICYTGNGLLRIPVDTASRASRLERRRYATFLNCFWSGQVRQPTERPSESPYRRYHREFRILDRGVRLLRTRSNQETIVFLKIDFSKDRLSRDRKRSVFHNVRSGISPRLPSSCSMIVTMAKELGVGVVAEGVETTGHAAVLMALKCDEAQGWLYAKAMSARDFAEFARQASLRDESRSQSACQVVSG